MTRISPALMYHGRPSVLFLSETETQGDVMGGRCTDDDGALEQTSPAGREDPDLLRDVVQSVLRRAGADWQMHTDDFWCHVCAPDEPIGLQGWKLHVSATPLSAPHVLSRAAPVLVDAGCRFKFARSIAGVSELVSTRFARAGAGKFITAYPDDTDQLIPIAEALHAATWGLAGPSILSDRPYRPGSLVHYRFGAFVGTRALTNDGTYETRLTAPDGSLVSDRRDAWFEPPDWAQLPDAPTPPRPPRAAPAARRAVVLGGRYVVSSAIQHANKGGVYRAVDQVSGADVVIKHARSHAASTLAGTDARDALRNEAAMLQRLTDIVPGFVATLEQGGDQFLVEELVRGTTLRHWVHEQLEQTPEPDRGLPADVALRRAQQLVELVAAAHRAGVVLRDLNPNNVMVADDETLRLVDLECVTYPGTPVVNAYTVAYASREVVAMPSYGPAPAQSADLHSLGATLFFLATGVDPAFPDDAPAIRTATERLEPLVAAMATRNRGLRLLAPAIIGLTAEDHEARWTLPQVLDSLRPRQSAAAAGRCVAERTAVAPAWLPADGDRLLEEGLDHLLGSMTPDAGRLWRSGSFGSRTDPCNAQHGAAGVLAVLARAYEELGDRRLGEGVRSAAGWLARTAATQPSGLPGLYFGRAGTAWALYEAARALDAPELAGSAVAIIRDLPVRWPNPDVCHGAAGAGLALAHLWQATGDPALGERLAECAEGLLAAAERGPAGVLWPIPASFDSELAGLRHLGFAHGVAGVGTFLLAAGASLGEPSFIDAAREAGSTLARAADVRHGEALWPEAPGAATTRSAASVHWCNGASGIGTFLVRLWLADGDERYRRLAELAAVAVYRRRWQGSAVSCHGVAGGAEFLLDLAAAGCGDRYRVWAQELAACIYLRHARLGGRRVVGDETQRSVTADFNTGLAGVLGLLLRLSHGGPRWFMAPEPSLTAVADAAPGR
ncbi:MAG: class IV lanthionine synthetase LanL [Solirubrobacteraceae bacterium]